MSRTIKRGPPPKRPAPRRKVAVKKVSVMDRLVGMLPVSEDTLRKIATWSILGAGGAGVAVAYGLLRQGARHVAVHDTDADRLSRCTERLARRFGPERVSDTQDLAEALDHAQGLVNATPVGMTGHPGTSVPADVLRPGQWVSDVVYFPLETELIGLARARGCRVLPGGGMAVGQAIGAFEWFTGVVPDADRMARHFVELTAAV